MLHVKQERCKYQIWSFGLLDWESNFQTNNTKRTLYSLRHLSILSRQRREIKQTLQHFSLPLILQYKKIF